MNARKIGYWVTTGLAAAALGAGGLGQLSRSPEMVESMHKLGYPVYMMTLLGAWKLAGALAILVPGTPRLKEWAYAGITFLLTGAAISHAASGDPAGKVIAPLMVLGLSAASWALRPESRKLESKPAAPESGRSAATPRAAEASS